MISTQDSELHVVLGARGAVGSALTSELLQQGLRVRAVSRLRPDYLPATVDWKPADATDAASVQAAVQGGSVVYMVVQPEYTRWAQEFPALLAAVLEGVSQAGARLVFADNLYSYGPVTGALTEISPEAPQSRKGAVRLALAGTLLAAHRAGRLPVVIARASDYYGPGVHSSAVGSAFFGAIQAGKRPQWIGRSDQLHSFSFIGDVARALVMLARHPTAFGQVWHVPAAEPLTATGFAAQIAAQAHTRPTTPSTLSGLPLRALGLFIPLLRELADVQYQFSAPFVIDGTRFADAFGFRPTPHPEATGQTLTWLNGR